MTKPLLVGIAHPAQEHWDLRLYVAGQTDKSMRAISNLGRICEEHLEGRYSIEVMAPRRLKWNLAEGHGVIG